MASCGALDRGRRDEVAPDIACRSRRRHHRVDQPERQRVRRTDADARHQEQQRAVDRRLRQDGGDTDIGEKSDRRLGHREPCAGLRQPEPAVARNADPAAHGNALAERHQRLRISRDQPVHPVFGSKIRVRLGRPAGQHQRPRRPHVAAGAKAFRPVAFEQHRAESPDRPASAASASLIPSIIARDSALIACGRLRAITPEGAIGGNFEFSRSCHTARHTSSAIGGVPLGQFGAIAGLRCYPAAPCQPTLR